MTLTGPHRILILSLMLALPVFAARTVAQNATAEAHKAWMNDASDAQEDFRASIASADAKAAAAALMKIDGLMAKTETYWAAKKMTDGVKLTRAVRSHASAGAAAAKIGKLTDASGAFDKMNTACNACHELHLEQR
jgi:glutaredoxin 2